METTTTRRALLKAAPIAAGALAIPVVAAIPPSAYATEWDNALRAYRTALAEDEAYEAPYRLILDEWEAGRPSMDGIHWKEFTFADRNYVARMLDLDKAWSAFLAGENKTWWGRDHDAIKARHRAALDSVQAFRDAEERHERDSGMTAADEKYEALGMAASNAEWALMMMPAPHTAALLWKLEKLVADEHSENPRLAQVLADARRVLGGEALS